MGIYPFNQEEKNYNKTCQTGKSCEKCECKLFEISTGYDYIVLRCNNCGYEEDWTVGNETIHSL